MNENSANRLTWHFVSATTIAIALSCSERDRHLADVPPADAYIVDRDQFDDDVWEIARTFENFDRIRNSLLAAEEVEIFEGLPHDIWESELHKSELADSKTIRIAGTLFYAEPLSLPAISASQILNVVADRSSFVPFRGYKSCGGFHADWCLVWNNGADTYAAELCFGCNELMVFRNDERILYCDIWDGKKFEKCLKPLRTNRPRGD